MPKPNERHHKARSLDDAWGPVPSRSQQLEFAITEDEPAKRPPGKKDRKNLCKQNHWGPHEGEIQFDDWGSFKHPCEWDANFRWKDRTYTTKWRCHHIEVCKYCGKHIRESWDLKNEECPDWNPVVPEGIYTEIREREARYSKWTTRQNKHIPSGPQGYRKPRA